MKKKSQEIQIPVSTDKDVLEHTHQYWHLWLFSNDGRGCGPPSLKYLLVSGPFQKNLLTPGIRNSSSEFHFK